MPEKARNTVHLKWVRSGIAFSHRQKTLVRSLGLRRLNQVVERPDTPQIRGIAAKIPHLVEVVSGVPALLWPSTPEYTIHPPVEKAAIAGAEAPTETKEETQAAVQEVELPVRGHVTPASAGKHAKAEHELSKPEKTAKPPRRAAAEKPKSSKAGEGKKKPQAKAEKEKEVKPSKPRKK